MNESEMKAMSEVIAIAMGRRKGIATHADAITAIRKVLVAAGLQNKLPQ